MRIGIMLRSIDEMGGVGVYTRNIVEELLRIDRKNEYFLFYRTPKNLGLFSKYQNVTERYIPGKSKAFWDQVAIPYACWKDKTDLIFHPKFTLPLFAPCKAVMAVHGADWFIPEQAKYYTKWDVRYMQMVMPLYFKKASAVISVSQETTDNFNSILKLPPAKIITIYFGPARFFKPVADPDQLEKVKARYNLPEKFILTLTKRLGDGRKNFGQIVKAYSRYHERVNDPYKLVVGGKDCHLFREEYAIPSDGYGGDILFPGWINQRDMPAVFSLAGLYLYPSNLEAFPIPLTEAMACGTPIVTSNVNGLREIAGDAAILVDPLNTQAIADSIYHTLNDEDLRAELSKKGLERATLFSWDACAMNTLALFEKAASK
jgi:glycosyltransferase involved in cell wall biosynthesis